MRGRTEGWRALAAARGGWSKESAAQSQRRLHREPLFQALTGRKKKNAGFNTRCSGQKGGKTPVCSLNTFRKIYTDCLLLRNGRSKILRRGGVYNENVHVGCIGGNRSLWPSLTLQTYLPWHSSWAAMTFALVTTEDKSDRLIINIWSKCS